MEPLHVLLVPVVGANLLWDAREGTGWRTTISYPEMAGHMKQMSRILLFPPPFYLLVNLLLMA